MLGHFTERATSRGRSRSFSGQGHTTVSRNESEQRRALLLPQEFKELGSERLVIVLENCKPILGEKIRYHREKVFRARLLPPPTVPAMDMDLHFATVQRRWTWAPDEIGVDQGLRLEQLALDMPNLPDFAVAESDIDIKAVVNQFFSGTLVSGPAGGVVEEVCLQALDEPPELESNLSLAQPKR
jgi:type IV secretion system protein VirD4